MFRIMTLNKISPIGMETYDRSRYQWGDEIENPDAIMVRSASMHEMDLPESVLAIARAGAGVNNIPLEKCADAGVVVFNTPGANANAVKEMVVLGLLIASRKVAASMEWVQGLKGKGDEVNKLVEKGKSAFVGPEIKGKKLGVIGLGAIGIQVANVATSLGMTVYGYDPYISVDAAWGLSRKIIHAEALSEIYANCDYITLHVPSNTETKGMINAASMAMMKHGVRILNFARGDLVVSADLIDAMDNGKVAVYVTDFADDSLLGRENVVAFPHLGASTPESEDNCAVMAAQELQTYLETGNIVNSVNMPNVSLAKSGLCRICAIHKNVSGVLTKLSQAISDNGINIENMISGSRKEYGYAMFDLGEKADAALIEKLSAIENVIRIRVI